MIDLGFMRNTDVAVLGLGRTGLAAVQALRAGGARVAAWDDGAGARKAARAAGLDLARPGSQAWKAAATLVLSPGIPHTHPAPHPAVAAMRERGVRIIGDIELFCRARGAAACIGVTGTNGKSTVTSLIGHILESAGRPVAVGGNLGRGVLDLPALGADGTYVVELSSFQLELIDSGAFDVAVLINISPDHLERHGGMAGYVAAKRRVFANQTAGMTAIVGIDDARARRVRDQIAAEGRRVIPISARSKAAGGVFVRDGVLHDDLRGKARPVLTLSEAPALPGQHNAQNAAAAFAAARAIGLRAEVIARAIRTYPGLAHRQEPVATVDGIAFVNDSKATNPDSARRALACYPDVYWIAGGKAKETGIALPRHLARHVRHAFLIGESAADFAASLSGMVPVTRSGTLDRAVADAHRQARTDGAADPVVLLSPACASYDQFRDFEQRGDTFRRLVASLGAGGQR